MAKGKTLSVAIVINNLKSSPVTKTVELIVKNDTLVPDTNETEVGVNTANLKN